MSKEFPNESTICIHDWLEMHGEKPNPELIDWEGHRYLLKALNVLDEGNVHNPEALPRAGVIYES